MDKKEQRLKQFNYSLLFVGILLSAGLMILQRGGIGWLSAMNWSSLSILQWILIILLFLFSLVIQYFFFLLLRYSVLKYVLLGAIPVFWLYNNGIIALDQFLGWTTETGKTMGWFSIIELIGWFIGAIYMPVLVVSGAIGMIFDSTTLSLTQSCYYARLAVDMAGILPSEMMSYSINMLSVVWDLISNSFVQELLKSRDINNGLFKIELSELFGLSRFFQNVGYSICCLIH